MANMCLILIIFSWFFVGLCQGLGGGGGGGGGGYQPLCMEELLPCKANLQRRPSTPTASCCVPLIKFVSTAAKCLCDVFTNPATMISFNATQEDALHLAKGCGAVVDKSFCDIAGSTTVSPSQSNFSSPSLHTNFTAQSKSIFTKKKKEKKKKKSKKKSAANPISKFRESSLLVALYGLFVAMNV